MATMQKPPVIKRSVGEYHVYDPGARKLGNFPITDRDGARTVLLTKDQARYWLDQGIIGETPLADLGEDQRHVVNQFSRGRIDPPPEHEERRGAERPSSPESNSDYASERPKGGAESASPEPAVPRKFLG